MQKLGIRLTANTINAGFSEGKTLGNGVHGMKDSGCILEAILIKSEKGFDNVQKNSK